MPGANDRVQLVDKQDDLALGILHFLEHGLEPLFKFAAILRTGNQCAHVERHNAPVLQAFRYIAAHDALRQPFDNRRLAYPGLANEHGIVFGAARQHLDGATDLLITANDRIEFGLLREFGEIAPVAFERFIGGLRVLRGDPLAAAHLLQRAHEPLTRDPQLPEEAPGRAPVIRHGKQQVLDRNELIVQFTRFVLGLGEQLIEAAGDVDLIGRRTGRAANFWQTFQLLLDTPFETVRVHVGLGENGCGQSALLFEQRGE